jgi:hypothetical protein
MRTQDLLDLIDEDLEEFATEADEETEAWKRFGRQIKIDLVTAFGDNIDEFSYHQFKKALRG